MLEPKAGLFCASSLMSLPAAPEPAATGIVTMLWSTPAAAATDALNVEAKSGEAAASVVIHALAITTDVGTLGSTGCAVLPSDAELGAGAAP